MAKPSPAPVGPTRAIGYVRVSTTEQGVSGLGLAAQRSAIEAACSQRGWTLAGVEEDIASGKSTNGRHGLARAIQRIEGGEAEALIVTKLDRLARSSLDFANHLDRARRAGWSLVILDLGLDTASTIGQFTASVMAAVAELERAMIGDRTRQALAEAKKRGTRLGRPDRYRVTEEVRCRVVTERAEGRSLRAIADGLTSDGIPTALGKAKWAAETVRQVLLAEGSSG
ncbi:MAG TPA: recombinase family protein [Phycisphaerales bacterium]|nr:recombinase family protein [Phycisphaerales bacterium]